MAKVKGEDRVAALLLTLVIQLAKDKPEIEADNIDALHNLGTGAAVAGDIQGSIWYAATRRNLLKATPQSLADQVRSILALRGVQG